MSLVTHGQQYPETIFIRADGLGIVDSIGIDAFTHNTKRKRQIAFREFVSLLKKLKLIPEAMHVGALARGMDSNAESGYIVTAWQEATKVKAQGPQNTACEMTFGCPALIHDVTCPTYKGK